MTQPADSIPQFSAAGRAVAAHIVQAYDASATHHRIRLPQPLPRDGQNGHGDFAIDHRHSDTMSPPERLQAALLRHREQPGFAEVSAFADRALQDAATPEPQRVTRLVAALRQVAPPGL